MWCVGKIEQKISREVRRTRINSAIITTLAAVGVLSVALMAPNVLQALGRFGLINPRQKKYGINKSLKRLIERGYIRVEGIGKQKSITLTPKGEKYAALLGEGRLAPRRPKRWDGKWRMLMFDIPERRKRLREIVRMHLIEFGFERMQDSVWVYPYDCEDLIALLKIEYGVEKDILYIIADAIENDFALRKHFNLNK